MRDIKIFNKLSYFKKVKELEDYKLKHNSIFKKG
jgi:hypothetical protein